MSWMIEPGFYGFELRMLEQMDGISFCNWLKYQTIGRLNVKPICSLWRSYPKYIMPFVKVSDYAVSSRRLKSGPLAGALN